MKRSTEFLKSLDVKLILILLALCVTSIAAIYSSQQTGQYGESNFAMKQGLNYIIGVVLLLLVASIDLDQLQKIVLATLYRWICFTYSFENTTGFHFHT